MTRYFVTGATGFLGRHVVRRLLDRADCEAVYALVRPASQHRLTDLTAGWPNGDRVVPVPGNLTAPDLGVNLDELPSRLDHVVHLGAIYDFTADEEINRVTNVSGTGSVISLASLVGATLHHVSSVAVAGEHEGQFSETDFDLGQRLPSAYHATKFDAERLVREQRRVPWRVYRPSAIVGDSRTGEMDKVDGPYYFLPAISWLRRLPDALPLIAPDLGASNIVPVDYVADAIVHLMHADTPSGATYHLVNPEPQPIGEVYNAFARAAGAPRIRASTPGWISAPARRSVRALGRFAASGAGQLAGSVRAVLGELGVPADVVPHLSFAGTFDSTATRAALAGSGLEVPALGDYADVLYRYWRRHLDPDRARRPDPRGPLYGRVVLITGASSGIGRASAREVARRGAVALLVARRSTQLEELRDEIVAAGGRAAAYPCDLTEDEAVEGLIKQVLIEHGTVDMLVNNAGRSIRRSVHLSVDRLHDFERTMALNYFGPMRLILGLLPHMRERRFGRIVNVTTMGTQVTTPRFSAYLASKSALEMFGRVANNELLGDNVTCTSVRMPLVRTPMIEATPAYRAMPAVSPEKAARLVLRALVRHPETITGPTGTVLELARILAPRAARTVAHLGYGVTAESAPEARERKRPLPALAATATRLLWRRL
ncbi:MAG: SDR family oxidoreductase [Pseudonocardiaceae bacterium]|nr:SDR family oxidoreductase [Pseudonocardiaceae bacterium]